jgi:WD40 repeat protein
MAPQDETRLNVSGRSWSSQLLPVLALLAAALCKIGTGHAEQENEGLPTGPILRIETGLHGGLINRIDTDAANRFAVTSSDDKTVRVWSLPEGWLLRILRLPLDSGNAGKAYAVAISPDGGTIAAGGWTGSQGHFNIFLFDRASGEQTKRLADLPNTVLHLAYSPDGQRLAAASWGSNGIRVFDVGHGYRPLPSDTDYKDGSYSAMFDRAGRLVTTSDDGFVRRYAAPIARFKSKIHDPESVVFSPDGSRVAVGFDDIPKVVVLSGSDLTQIFEANIAGVGMAISSVGWSRDGRFLFAGVPGATLEQRRQRGLCRHPCGIQYDHGDPGAAIGLRAVCACPRLRADRSGCQRDPIARCWRS